MIELPKFFETATGALSGPISHFKMDVQKKSDNEFELKTKNYRIGISLFHGHMPSLTAVLGPLSDRSIEYGVGAILDAVEFESRGFTPADIASAEDLNRELSLLARALEQCLAVLEMAGDAIWKKVDLYIKEKVMQWEQREIRKGPEAFELSQKLRHATLAFSREDYKGAVELWGSIEDKLSPLEQRRLVYARRNS